MSAPHRPTPPPEAATRAGGLVAVGVGGVFLAITILAALGVPMDTRLWRWLAAFFGFVPLVLLSLAVPAVRSQLLAPVPLMLSAAFWGLAWALVRASGARGLGFAVAVVVLWAVGSWGLWRGWEGAVGRVRAWREHRAEERSLALGETPARTRARTVERQARYRTVPLAPGLLAALTSRDAEGLAAALASGAHANARGDRGRTPLMLAAEAWWVDGVEILMRAGADPDVLDDAGIDAERLAVYDRERVHDPDALAIARLLRTASGA